MKKPNKSKHDGWLRRILDPDRYESIIYYEEAVLADSTTLQAKGYYVFLVTETGLHYLQPGKDSSLNSSNGWSLTDFHSIQHLNDAATFFGENDEVAQNTRHIRCHVSDQVASPFNLLDFYSFYEDSALYHHLFQAWQQAHTKIALPIFYPTERNKLNRLTNAAVQTLYMHLESQLLATVEKEENTNDKTLGGVNDEKTDEDARARIQAAKIRAKKKKALDVDYWDVRLRIKILEELTLCVSAHKSCKELAFASLTLIPFLLKQLKQLSRYRAYLLGANCDHIWSYYASNEEMLLEDEVDNIRLIISIWTFFSRLLAGSESIPERTKLLAWSSTSVESELHDVMDTLFLLGGIQVYGPPATSSSSSSSSTSLPPQTPHGLRSGSSFTTPTRFLDQYLDPYLSTLAQRKTGGDGGGFGSSSHPLADEDEERYKGKYLYDLRAKRRWREGVLFSTKPLPTSSFLKPSESKEQKPPPVGLHLRDIPQIIQSYQERVSEEFKKRGPGRARKGEAEMAKIYDEPLSAEEVGYETVLVANEADQKKGLGILQDLIPEMEVVFLECMFHFMQLLEFVLETHVSTLTFNLESLFKHLLSDTASDGGDFKTLQIPLFARGLVYMCQKERRETVAYYTFIYAAVLAKFMLRSSDLQAILHEHHFLDLLSVDHTNVLLTANKVQNKLAGQSSQPTLALLPDVKFSLIPSGSRGLHFHQRTKPLLETMLKLLLDG